MNSQEALDIVKVYVKKMVETMPFSEEMKSLKEASKVLQDEVTINDVLKRHIRYVKRPNFEVIETNGYGKEDNSDDVMYSFTPTQEGTKGDFDAIKEWCQTNKFIYGWEYMRDLKRQSKKVTRKMIWDWMYMNKMNPCDLLVTDGEFGSANNLELEKNFKLSPTFEKCIKEHSSADYPKFSNYDAVLDCVIPIAEVNIKDFSEDNRND